MTTRIRSTLSTIALLLAVALLGTACGKLLATGDRRRQRPHDRVQDR
jgi:hypothetical protein